LRVLSATRILQQLREKLRFAKNLPNLFVCDARHRRSFSSDVAFAHEVRDGSTINCSQHLQISRCRRAGRIYLEQMIELLNAGLTAESPLRMIERGLARASAGEPEQLGSSRWVM